MSPADAAEVIFTKSRRFTFTTRMSHLLRGAMDRTPDPHVGAAAAEIAAHGLVDLRVGRLLCFQQEAGGRHDLSRLTVAALRDVLGHPRFLQRMRAVGRKTLNCCDPFPYNIFERGAAGTDRLSVREHGAR